MSNHTFVWTDLSTYKPSASLSFYQSVFDWQIHEESGYHVAYQNQFEIAGIYETPAFFKKINMPHFWMNYIQVDDVERTVERARQLNAIIEIAKESFFGGHIALIRDPLGAGFTVYDGNLLHQPNQALDSMVAGRELQVSDAPKAITFYSGLLDWNITAGRFPNQFNCFTKEGLSVASIQEVDPTLKGKYEYWVTIFATNDLASTSQKIITNGGSLISA